MASHRLICASIICASLLTACTDPNRHAKTGAVVGAIAGAVIGHQMHHDKGRYWGAALGALAGAGVGDYMDEQQAELERELAEEQATEALQIDRMGDESLRLTMDSEVSFDFDSAEIKGAWFQSLNKLAEVINRYRQTVVHVVGHTDSVGSEAYNQILSERRAWAVSNYLRRRGASPDRIQSEGRGERQPRESNATEAGRQLNRRVEIYLKPVVEGREGEAYRSPDYY